MDRLSPGPVAGRVRRAEAQRDGRVLGRLRRLPDFFVEEGLGIEQLVAAPAFLVFEFVSLFFARVLIVWLYKRTGQSVLLVAIFHANFDATISELSFDIFPGSNAARFSS